MAEVIGLHLNSNKYRAKDAVERALTYASLSHYMQCINLNTCSYVHPIFKPKLLAHRYR